MGERLTGRKAHVDHCSLRSVQRGRCTVEARSRAMPYCSSSKSETVGQHLHRSDASGHSVCAHKRAACSPVRYHTGTITILAEPTGELGRKTLQETKA
ncbi:hypothetical protein RRG08_021116 [Elysia crispata]|uniref:Uncharacterized protein n=1 Tax=Elysia crispata TaxID=231223 RepID=A0AAE0Z5W0_9GAST|nr:hypothetical protein RRG08_021116 [Elysia crispata]